MLKAIAVTPVWDEVNETVIEEGSEFSMGDDKILSLVRIGAAKLKDSEAVEPVVKPVEKPEI
jgi:hypothetical protein